jgi:tetratricopeptide (TPR) repeat protein
MKKSKNRITRILTKIEGERFSLLTGFISLFSIIYIRNLFESIFEGAQILGFSPLHSHSFYMVFIHFPLFYLSLFVWIYLTLCGFTRENWVKVGKFLLIGMSVIAITPFIDIIVSKGSGYKLTYLKGFEQFTEIHKIFIFTRDLLQASWGQRVELLLSIFGSFLYVLVKTKRFFRSLFAGILVYLIIFLHGTLPNSIARIPSYLGSDTLGFRTIITNGILPIDSQNYAVIFSLLIIIGGSFLLRKYKKSIHGEIFNFKSSFSSILFLCIGILVSVIPVSKQYPFIFYNPFSYLIIILSIFTVIFAISATRMKIDSTGFQLSAISTILFSLVIGPFFLLFTFLLYVCKKWVKPKYVTLVPGFLAGFFIIYHGDSLRTVLPFFKNNLLLRGHKLSGWCYFLNGEFKKSLLHYEKADRYENNDNTTKRIGQCYLSLGELDKGIEILEGLQTLDYDAIKTLGQSYMQKSQPNRSIEIYRKGIEAHIEPADFYIKISEIASRTMNEKLLEESLEKALLYGNPRYKIYQIRGDFYMRKGELESALGMYKRALFLNTRSVPTLAGMGVIYYKRNDLLQAESLFLRALEIDPDNDALLNNLGALYIVSKKFEEAERLFHKSLKKNPNQPEAYFNLGLIYEQKGRKEDAIMMYRKVLQLNPSYIPAAKRLEELNQ